MSISTMLLQDEASLYMKHRAEMTTEIANTMMYHVGIVSSSARLFSLRPLSSYRS